MPSKAPETDLWTTKEVANFLKVSLHSVWLMASVPQDDGGPPVFRIKTGYNKRHSSRGRKNLLRFPRKEFIEWCKKGGRQ